MFLLTNLDVKFLVLPLVELVQGVALIEDFLVESRPPLSLIQGDFSLGNEKFHANVSLGKLINNGAVFYSLGQVGTSIFPFLYIRVGSVGRPVRVVVREAVFHILPVPLIMHSPTFNLT